MEKKIHLTNIQEFIQALTDLPLQNAKTQS